MANAKRVDAADDLLDELVHQFSDPFAFYRELVQNSIDAGSTRIDIVLRFQPDVSGGTATAEISDWGEGMNRQVIEDYLLTKFRSSKENDLTKIGKFGIGFVSVFAPGPQLVVVDTGRDGEFWRILFKEDRTYELFKNAEPVEGTRVTLHKRMSPSEYETFHQKSLESLRSWCRHSEAEVTFAAGTAAGMPPEGDPLSIGEPFVVNAPYQVEYEEEGTRIVAGPSRDEPPQCGLYNRGLTLLETKEALVPGVAFKLLSRYLEHTLTRDNVLRDEHFDRAMSLVRKVADGALMDRLPSELQRAAEAGAWPDYGVLLRFAASRKVDPFKMAFPSAHGGTVTGDRLQRTSARADALPCSTEDSRLVQRMAAHGLFALKADPKSELAQSVCELFRLEAAADVSLLYSAAEAVGGDPQIDALTVSVNALLDAAGAKASQASIANLLGAAEELPWITVDALGEPLPAAKARISPFVRGSGKWLCLNRGHARVANAIQIAASAPAVAAALLLRMISSQGKPFGESDDLALTLTALRS